MKKSSRPQVAPVQTADKAFAIIDDGMAEIVAEIVRSGRAVDPVGPAARTRRRRTERSEVDALVPVRAAVGT